MVLVTTPDAPLYYRETTEPKRACRFCLKPVTTVAPRQAEKPPDRVAVQVVRGKTTTFIHLDEDEAKKVQAHGEHALKKVQKIHKSLVWNLLIGRSFVDKIPKGKQGSEEINIDHDENSEFDADNPKTWSVESLDFIGSLLKANEFHYDGFVVLFCVENDARDPSIDFDELAWELEKCLTYHFVYTKLHLLMNEEATMSRKGLDPVSRKTKTPGRKKSGFLVYMAYQLMDSVGADQMVGEAINRGVDLGVKKRQLLGSLGECKMMPVVDERLRKMVKELKEFMGKDQLGIVQRLRDIKDPESMELLLQFLSLLKSNGTKDHRSSGFMGLNQFLSFLNHGGGGGGAVDDVLDGYRGGASSRAPSRVSNVTSPRVGGKQRGSTLPRPTSSIAGGSRKQSISSQRSAVSSRSTTPDTPKRENGHHRESSLASIPASESSTPETLRKQEHKASRRKPAPPSSNGAKPSPRPSPRVGGRAQRQVLPPGSSITPRSGLSSTVSSVNGDSPSRRMSSASRLSNTSNTTPTSPHMTTSASRRNKREPPTGKMITREDLRRMNKSYPSPNGKAAPGSSSPATKAKPTSSSYSRATIPMS